MEDDDDRHTPPIPVLPSFKDAFPEQGFTEPPPSTHLPIRAEPRTESSDQGRVAQTGPLRRADEQTRHQPRGIQPYPRPVPHTHSEPGLSRRPSYSAQSSRSSRASPYTLSPPFIPSPTAHSDGEAGPSSRPYIGHGTHDAFPPYGMPPPTPASGYGRGRRGYPGADADHTQSGSYPSSTGAGSSSGAAVLPSVYPAQPQRFRTRARSSAAAGYPCDHPNCGKAYTTIGNLNRHKRRIHGAPPPPPRPAPLFRSDPAAQLSGDQNADDSASVSDDDSMDDDDSGAGVEPSPKD